MLDEIRNKINEIDEKILELLKERLELVEQVGKIKEKNSDNSKSFMRPEREASVINKLLKKNNSAYPKPAIINIWRNIIASSVNAEQPLSICVFCQENNQNNYWLAREYFGNVCQIKISENPEDIIKSVNEGAIRIGVLPTYGKWWQGLPEDVRIFAKLGDEKVGYGYCIAKIDLDYQSYEDCKFIYINEDGGLKELDNFEPDKNLAGCYF